MLSCVLGAPWRSSLIHHKAFTTHEEQGKALIEDKEYFLGHGATLPFREDTLSACPKRPLWIWEADSMPSPLALHLQNAYESKLSHTQQCGDGESSKHGNQQNEMASGWGLDITAGNSLTSA